MAASRGAGRPKGHSLGLASAATMARSSDASLYVTYWNPSGNGPKPS
jgi:hypothetical protein